MRKSKMRWLAAIAILTVLTGQAIASPVSSGTTPISTSGDTQVTLISSTTQVTVLVIVNEGTAKGWVSIDGGSTWFYLPAATTGGPSCITVNYAMATVNLVAKRIAGGTDLSGLYAFGY